MLTLKTNVKKLIPTLIILLTWLIHINYININENIQKMTVDTNRISEKQTIPSPEVTDSKNQIRQNKVPAINQESNYSNEANEKTKLDIAEDKKQSVSNKELSIKQPSRGGSLHTGINLTLTFYSSLPEENGGFDGINCLGEKLIPGTVANNVLPLGTKIHTDEFGILTVADKGGSNFDTIHRLDVFVPRISGESDITYIQRVNDMGVVKVKGSIIK